MHGWKGKGKGRCGKDSGKASEDFGKGHCGKVDFGKGDFDKDYGKGDSGKVDFGKGDFGKGDYGKGCSSKDSNNVDFGKGDFDKDYGKVDWLFLKPYCVAKVQWHKSGGIGIAPVAPNDWSEAIVQHAERVVTEMLIKLDIPDMEL